MREPSYRERDFAFGQIMLTVRTQIRLTQARLAEALGVSRKAVIDWEGGISYPHAEHLKRFVALAIQHQAFPAGYVAEEVRAIWAGAHQKVLLDETWLTTLLSSMEAPPSFEPAKETAVALSSQADWNNAPAVRTFYGRGREVELLTGWVMGERCRVVSVLGLGGIGKSALTVSLMHTVAQDFEVVIWRSLCDFPTCDELMEELVQVLALRSGGETATSLERRPGILLEQMRKTRILLVLDKLEAVMEGGEGAGKMRPGFESFGRFLTLAGETAHQSCVLLTSRELPAAASAIRRQRSVGPFVAPHRSGRRKLRHAVIRTKANRKRAGSDAAYRSLRRKSIGIENCCPYHRRSI